jgi:hypothetical protein
VRRAAAAAAAALLIAASGCGGGDERERPRAPARANDAEALLPRLGEPGLAVGLIESSGVLLRPPDGRSGPVAERWQRRVTDLRPKLLRLFVDWSVLQPDPGRPARLDQPVDGCARGAPPCLPWAGVRDQLRALAAQQRIGNGGVAMIAFYGVPAWAAAARRGCEAEGTEPRSRPITDAGLAAYAELVERVARLAEREGADVRFWAPWNEPNGPWFISPQRRRCDAGSRSLAPAVYARLARTMRRVLERLGGDRRLVVGELAGVARPTPRSTGVGEFLDALPDDVACSAAVLSQHAYLRVGGGVSEGSPIPRSRREGRRAAGDPVAALLAARDRRPCLRDVPVWITETGVGGVSGGERRDTSPQGLAAQCEAYDRRLREWARDGRITAAFQYSLREDPLFPVGLADAALTRTYPTYDLIRAWSRREDPTVLPPAGACGRAGR